jgi:hypothetical protein
MGIEFIRFWFCRYGIQAGVAGATKNPARNPGRAHVAIFNFRHYADLAAAVKLAGGPVAARG